MKIELGFGVLGFWVLGGAKPLPPTASTRTATLGWPFYLLAPNHGAHPSRSLQWVGEPKSQC